MSRPRQGASRDGKPSKRKTGLTAETWETIVKALPGIIRAVAELIKVVSGIR